MYLFPRISYYLNKYVFSVTLSHLSGPVIPVLPIHPELLLLCVFTTSVQLTTVSITLLSIILHTRARALTHGETTHTNQLKHKIIL